MQFQIPQDKTNEIIIIIIVIVIMNSTMHIKDNENLKFEAGAKGNIQKHTEFPVEPVFHYFPV